jgi:hypothetical protein
MFNETEDMRDARHDLHLLSVSDPAASANMMRHVSALSIMLAGRRGRDKRPGEPEIVGCFLLTHGDHHVIAAVTRKTGIDQVCLGFDVDDPVGPPKAIGLFRKDGDGVVMYGACRLWAPANDGHALLVPSESGEFGHFAFQPGASLRHIATLPSGDLEAGFRRAACRWGKLVGSAELRDAHRGAFMHVIQNKGREVFATATRLAA